MVTDRDVDVDPNEYERQLDDTQLVLLTEDVNRRVQALLQQGVPLPMAQIENHHLIGLLEVMVGRAKSLRVKEWHLVWVDAQLDNVETEVRLRMSGLLDGVEP